MVFFYAAGVCNDFQKEPMNQRLDAPAAAIDFNDEDSNTSPNPTFGAVLNARLSRRGLLRGSVGSVGTAMLAGFGVSACGGGDDAVAAPAEKLLGFAAVPKSLADMVSVPVGYTASVLFALGDPMVAGVTAYRNRVKNLIDYQSPCSTPGYPWGCAANVKNATLEGVTVHYNRQFGSLKLQASGDWQNPQDDSNGKQLARRAKRHGAIGISQQWQQFAAGATLLGSSKRYNDAANNEVLPGYGLLNLNASYDIDKRLQLAATLENSLDKQYELAKDYATPRRNLFVSLNYRY